MSNIVVGSDIVQPLTETGATQHDLVFETTMSSEQFFSLHGLNQFQTMVDRAYMTGQWQWLATRLTSLQRILQANSADKTTSDIGSTQLYAVVELLGDIALKASRSQRWDILEYISSILSLDMFAKNSCPRKCTGSRWATSRARELNAMMDSIKANYAT